MTGYTKEAHLWDEHNTTQDKLMGLSGIKGQCNYEVQSGMHVTKQMTINECTKIECNNEAKLESPTCAPQTEGRQNRKSMRRCESLTVFP